ncbi:MAG: TVP38/TMEM64 family protein [Clostridia bacterium]|nr:TVP38/TMEM64 family protein [Clostridia bacterium]MBO7288691.1 TVP38/TMEM64 family protein [Clostridia bacterium]
MKKTPSEEKLLKRKRIFALISFAVLLCVISFLTYFLIVRFSKIAKSGEEFNDFIKGYGTYGAFVAIGIQILQVFIALIPGEFVEIGMGYAYGWFEATLYSLLGVAIGSSLIFLLVKKFGIRFVEIFVSSDKINELKFIRSEEKLKRLTFILFFIPGTPKDLITYFIGLTRISLKDFLAITLFARIPSVVSSTVGGNFIGEKRYVEAVILFVVTALISLIGIKLYNILLKKIKEKAKRIKSFHSYK